MSDAETAARPLPRQSGEPLAAPDAPSPPPGPSQVLRVASSREVLGRGLLLIVGEMVQLVAAFILALYAIACCIALAVKANEAWHFMGETFETPRFVTSALGGLLAHSATYLVAALLAAIFAIKLLDLVVRVLQRRARLIEQGYLPR